MSGAIVKALPTCISGTLERVGFALGRKLLLKFTNLPFWQGRDFHSRRGIWRESKGESNSPLGFLASVSIGRVGRNHSVSVIIQRHNFHQDAPVAQLDRVHGYEP